MEKSNYYVKRFLDEHPLPKDEWVFVVLKSGFRKIAKPNDDNTFLWCVGKQKAKFSEVDYWLEEL